MHRKVFLSGAFFMMTCLAQAGVEEGLSAVSHIVLYPSGARVTRTSKINCETGMQTVRLKGVQPDFDENSLSVSGTGSARVTILGAGIKTVYDTVSPDMRMRTLEMELENIEVQLAKVQSEGVVVGQKKEFLKSILLFSGEQIPKDLVTKYPLTEELKGTLNFLETEGRTVEDALSAAGRETQRLIKERQKILNDMNQVRSSDKKAERVLDVELDCVKPGAFDLEISYMLPKAGWYPLYDARVNFDKAKVGFTSFAAAFQRSGEDWTDTAFTVSTSQPSIGGVMPELPSWIIFTQQHIRRSFSKGAPEMVMAARNMAMDSMVTQEMESDGAAMPAEVMYAQSEMGATAVVYKVQRPVTLSSDGSEARVPLALQEMDAVFEYAATPKLSPFAYLKATVVNGSEDTLIPGRINVFLDGSYVGNSALAKTVAPKETVDLFLGVDEGVDVKRIKLEEKSDDTLIGNIPSFNKKISYVYKLTAENKKTREITLKLFDHIPVSQDDKVKVANIHLSQKPDTDQYQNRPGVHAWTLVLKPGEKKEITIAYTIEFPRDIHVEGLQ